LVYTDDVNIWGGSNVKEKAETLVIASMETRLDVSVDKTMYMVMCRNQNAGRSHNMEIDNSSFERKE
jgi:hypothetical protein